MQTRSDYTSPFVIVRDIQLLDGTILFLKTHSRGLSNATLIIALAGVIRSTFLEIWFENTSLSKLSNLTLILILTGVI